MARKKNKALGNVPKYCFPLSGNVPDMLVSFINGVDINYFK